MNTKYVRVRLIESGVELEVSASKAAELYDAGIAICVESQAEAATPCPLRKRLTTKCCREGGDD
ncbi:MAG: hypothetical protein AAGB48_01925 [Planctomycetota bacterium]